MATQLLRWQFTVVDFARMGEAGIFTEDDRVELIDGEVIAMSPIGPKHVAIVNRLNALMNRQVGDHTIVSVQNLIQLNDYTEPQPDLAVLRARDDFYLHALPLSSDVLLIVEVAETSLAYDREEKLPRYAQAGIPEVWIIDIEQEMVSQYTQPDGSRYTTEQALERGHDIVSPTLNALQLTVNQIFG